MTQDCSLLDDAVPLSHPEVYALCLELFNQPVLAGTEVYRLIGYGECANASYYILLGRYGQVWYDTHSRLICLDCLRGENALIGLSGESSDDYRRLDSWLTESGIPRAERIRIDLRPGESEITILGMSTNRS